MPSIWFLEIENIRLKILETKMNSSISTISSLIKPQLILSYNHNNSDYYSYNESYSDYEYEIHDPIKMPELPAELKVILILSKL